MEEIQKQLIEINKYIKQVEKGTIQIETDPTTALYLQQIVSSQVASVVPGYVASAVASLPTSTYSTGAPTGTAPTGSVWYEDTGVLATRKIHVYSGSAWVQFK